jgi:deoxyhypusine synthase
MPGVESHLVVMLNFFRKHLFCWKKEPLMKKVLFSFHLKLFSRHLFIFLFWQKVLWTPSKLIARLGKEINHEPLLGIQGKNETKIRFSNAILYFISDSNIYTIFFFHHYIVDFLHILHYIVCINFFFIYLIITHEYQKVAHSIIFLYFVGVLQNNIPVYCPGLTDGSLGDMLYFHSFHNPGLIVDIVQGFFTPFVFTLYCMAILKHFRKL